MVLLIHGDVQSVVRGKKELTLENIRNEITKFKNDIVSQKLGKYDEKGRYSFLSNEEPIARRNFVIVIKYLQAELLNLFITLIYVK